MYFVRHGKYGVRFAETEADLEVSQVLRHRAFHACSGGDSDKFDQSCLHLLVEDIDASKLVCCFRVLQLGTGAEIDTTYSAQFYQLDALKDYSGPMIEVGRFCIDPDVTDADVLRLAWAALTKLVEDKGIEMMFGCSSFPGISEKQYIDAFSLLKEKHLAPPRWSPRAKAPNIFPFAHRLKLRKPDLKAAAKAMPPLLKTYLMMGGWVSDHAVVDPHMNTLHVFTGIEVKSIPSGRARMLKRLSAAASC